MCCSCYRMPQNAFFPRTHDLLVSLKRKRKKKRKKEKKKTQRHFFSTLHPLSPVIFATATVLAFVLLLNSRFNFPCYTRRRMQRLLRYRPGSDAATFCAKDYKGHSLVQTSFTEPPNMSIYCNYITISLVQTSFTEPPNMSIYCTYMTI